MRVPRRGGDQSSTWQNSSDYCHFRRSIVRAPTAILSGMSRVTELPAADPTAARTHFEGLLAYETDCWDVHTSLGDAQRLRSARRACATVVRAGARAGCRESAAWKDQRAESGHVFRRHALRRLLQRTA